MKELFIISIIFILLTGCKNSMKDARARALNHETQRKDDLHQLKMADKRAATETRLMTIDVMYFSLRISGFIIIIGTGFAITWFVIGASIGLVQRIQVHRIRLDPVTRQYDALLYGPSRERQFLNLNTGEQRQLAESNEADVARIAETTKVQIAGVLATAKMAERGWINEIERGWIDEISRN